MRTPTSSRCRSSSAGSWYTRYAPARSSSSRPQQPHAEGPGSTGGQEVPHAVADHHRVGHAHAESIGRGDEQVGIGLGMLHLVSCYNRHLGRQPQQGDRGVFESRLQHSGLFHHRCFAGFTGTSRADACMTNVLTANERRMAPKKAQMLMAACQYHRDREHHEHQYHAEKSRYESRLRGEIRSARRAVRRLHP